MNVLVAATAAGLGVAVLVRGAPATPLRRLGRGGGPPVGGLLNRRRLLVAVLAVVGAVTFTRFGDRPHLLLLAATAAGAAYAAGALRSRATRRATRHRCQAETVDICDAVLAELAAGSPPARALAHTASDWSVLWPVARTAELGGDVADTLRTLAHQPGRSSFREIAAAWEVSARSGASLAVVLDRLASALRRDDEARQEVIASLGAPRATARVLAGLPVLGLALGAGIGGDPLAVLLESMLGAVCLLLGSVLAIAGLFWVEHIADSAEVV